MLQVIPVIDLKQNQVVHAKYGQRNTYQPIQSAICSASAPMQVVQALLKLYPFSTLYIADIDAILNTGNHAETIEAICHAHPQVTFWVDNGVRNINARILHAPQTNIRAVVGSENIHTLQDYRVISYGYESRHVLSLDKLDDNQLGAVDLHNTGLYWPDDVICMTLNNVGSQQGSDIARLKNLQIQNAARKKPARIFAAGGVRNLDDLQQLKQLGISGALIASALHNGEITAQQIQRFTNT
jgi:phosphoribosylformimino-5-aminoimidazole carboxamide ribotide isomerase